MARFEHRILPELGKGLWICRPLNQPGRVSLYEWLEDYRATALARNPVADEYFVSPSARVIFALVELDGQCRLDQLGVPRANFGDKGIAKRWRDDMARLIHPDRCPHAKAGAAMARLNELYEFMVA